MIEKNYQGNKYGRALVASSKTYVVGIIINSLGNDFFDKVLQGIEEAAKVHTNIKLVISKIKGYDEEEQLKSINNIVSDNELSALIITPLNTEMIITRLEKLDIPIISINNDLNSKRLAFVGPDYENSGLISGDIAKLLLPKNGNILIVAGSFKLLGHMLRVKGFKARFVDDGNYNIALIENQDDEETSYKVVKEYIKNHDIDLVYFCAAGIKGGLSAIKESNNDIKVITVDETQTVLENLKQGFISATITQQPFKQGTKAIEIISNFLIYGEEPLLDMNYTSNHVKVKHSFFNNHYEE